MKIIKASELLSRKDTKPFVLGALYSRLLSINHNKYFITTSYYKRSEKVFECDFDFEGYKKKYIEKLNYFSGFHGWFTKKELSFLDFEGKAKVVDCVFIIENDLNQTITTFFNALRSKIYKSDWALEEGLTENKKFFIRGFMEPRGSIDTCRPLLAQDYFYNSQKEISKAKLLFDFLDFPIYVANINFRELQNQYVTGENKRNTQFRIDLNWYAKNIGFINEYKAKIFDNCYHSSGSKIDSNGIIYFFTPQKDPGDTETFIRYINYFSNNIIGRSLSNSEINSFRKRLGFDSTTIESGRNKKIIDIFRDISEDKCAICGTTKTYTNQKTGRQHFEIHHMISYKNGSELDVLDNLVKLCPTCHDMMKKSSGRVIDQLEAIKKILREQEAVYEFCSTYLECDNIEELASKIQQMLG